MTPESWVKLGLSLEVSGLIVIMVDLWRGRKDKAGREQTAVEMPTMLEPARWAVNTHPAASALRGTSGASLEDVAVVAERAEQIAIDTYAQIKAQFTQAWDAAQAAAGQVRADIAAASQASARRQALAALLLIVGTIVTGVAGLSR